jgi:hypothetical protein
MEFLPCRLCLFLFLHASSQIDYTGLRLHIREDAAGQYRER